MKVRVSVKKICNKCKVIRRNRGINNLLECEINSSRWQRQTFHGKNGERGVSATTGLRRHFYVHTDMRVRS